MATFTKVLLSGSTAGQPVLVASSTVDQTIHTAVNSASQIDEIWLWATNSTNVPTTCAIGFGSTAAKDRVSISVPAVAGPLLAIPGLTLSSGVVSALAANSSAISLVGYVNRIAQ